MSPSFAARLQEAEAGAARRDDEDADAHGSRLDEARGKVLGIARDASDTAQSYGQRIKDAMASAAQSTRETAHDLSASASDVTAKISDQAQRGSTTVQEGYRYHGTIHARGTFLDHRKPHRPRRPRGCGGHCRRCGNPDQQQGRGAAGRHRHQSTHTAGVDLAQDVVDRSSRVATETIDAVKDSAQAHGLTTDKPIGEVVADFKSGSLADAAKQVASEVADAGKESAQTHFGSAADDAGDS